MATAKYPSYTVSGITGEIGSRLKGLGPLILAGEISGWRRYPSGHAYFTMKDEGAQISAVFFSTDLSRTLEKLGEDALKDGVKVELFGSVSVYANRGNYQFVARSARLTGVGDLMKRYLELKARLEAEGLFDRSRKRPLPSMPRRIGIVTSEAGAVIHDMCTVLTRRFPALEIRLYPCLVQGDGAPPTIIEGIEYFNSAEWRADVVIVARGGGSFEDLYCFNDESLARAVASSSIPTISAVGHETDFTLCDFAADVRAGTPSIAAEIAVPRLSDLVDRLRSFGETLSRALRSKGENLAQTADHLSDRLENALRLYGERTGRRLERAAVRLEAYSPYGVLERGYSLTTTEDGSVVTDASRLKKGDVVNTRFASGTARSKVEWHTDGGEK